MALIFERFQTAGIAELSYLVGDDSEGVAAVIDPRADVDCYLQLAREKQLSITQIFETHIHAHLVSGARDQYVRVETAKIFVSHEGGAHYGFDHEMIRAGDTFTLGSVLITVRHIPDYALSTAPPAPTYYPRMKNLNAKGPEVLGNLPKVPGLAPRFFKEAVGWGQCAD